MLGVLEVIAWGIIDHGCGAVSKAWEDNRSAGCGIAGAAAQRGRGLALRLLGRIITCRRW